MVNVKPVQLGTNTRMSFAKINEVLEMPNLIEIQINSYKWFLTEGLKEVFPRYRRHQRLYRQSGLGFYGLSFGE